MFFVKKHLNSLKRNDKSDDDIIFIEKKPGNKMLQLPAEHTIKAFKEAQKIAEKKKKEFTEYYKLNNM